jgi:hypothetical protein
MFDYRQGRPSTAFKLQPRLFRTHPPPPRFQAQLPLLRALEFLNGLETARILSLVCKTWLSTISRSSVWDYFSYSAAEERHEKVVNRLRHRWKCEFEGKKGSDEAALSKLVYAYVMRKTCKECGSEEKTLRVCKLLKRALCTTCQNLSKFQMISAESVLVDYKLTPDMLAEQHVEALEVKGKQKDGHSLFVYYVSDVERANGERGERPKMRSDQLTGIQLARKSELLRHFSEFGITHKKFLRLCFDTEHNPAYNYIRARSQQGARKIAESMSKQYDRWLQRTQSFMEDDEPDEKKEESQA